MTIAKTLMGRYNACLFAFRILDLKNKFWEARFMLIDWFKVYADSFRIKMFRK